MPDLVVTGPCRSGTALFHRLINDCIPNALCTNEVVPSMQELKPYFTRTRKAVNEGKPIDNRYARDGSLSDNSWRKGAELQARPVDKPLGGDWCMATKVMVGFMDRIDEMIDMGYPVAVVIRDPVYTLGSWGDPKTAQQTVGRITDNDLHEWWKNHPFPFDRSDAVGRRAEYWNYLAGKIWEATQTAPKGRIRVFRYEDVVADTLGKMQEFGKWTGMGDPVAVPKLKSANRDDRYPVDMDRIRKDASRLCPMRGNFGYR